MNHFRKEEDPMERYEKPVMMLEEIGDEIHTATKDTNGRMTWLLSKPHIHEVDITDKLL